MTVMTTGSTATSVMGIAAPAAASPSPDGGQTFAQVLSDTGVASVAPVLAPADVVAQAGTPVTPAAEPDAVPVMKPDAVSATKPDAVSTLTPEVAGTGPKVHPRHPQLPMKGQVPDHVSPDDAVAASVILSLQPSTAPLLPQDPPTDLPVHESSVTSLGNATQPISRQLTAEVASAQPSSAQPSSAQPSTPVTAIVETASAEIVDSQLSAAQLSAEIESHLPDIKTSAAPIVSVTVAGSVAPAVSLAISPVRPSLVKAPQTSQSSGTVDISGAEVQPTVEGGQTVDSAIDSVPIGIQVVSQTPSPTVDQTAATADVPATDVKTSDEDAQPATPATAITPDVSNRPHTVGSPLHTSVVSQGASSASSHANAVEVAHQVGRHIATSRLSSLTREHPLHLNVLLHPEDLGEVSVQLTLVSGRIDVQVSSQSDTTRDMLRQGMQDLRRQLSDSGVSVGDMDVHDGWSQQFNSSQDSANSADQRGSQQFRRADSTTTPSSRMTTPEPTVVHRPSRNGIDILA